MSAGEDGALGVWEMGVRRRETPAWREADLCQLCRAPFIWNVRAMMEKKQIGTITVLTTIDNRVYFAKTQIKNSKLFLLKHFLPKKIQIFNDVSNGRDIFLRGEVSTIASQP